MAASLETTGLFSHLSGEPLRLIPVKESVTPTGGRETKYKVTYYGITLGTALQIIGEVEVWTWKERT